MTTRVVPVVGVTFVPTYPTNLLTVAEQWFDPDTGIIPLFLRRDPTNEHDSNAIEVHCPALPAGATMIGHLDRETARRIAPRLDAGIVFRTEIHTIRVGMDVAITQVPA